ncbi:hypothetical protein [Acetobacter oeni]|nr:hypothetical protein [Acetobacter oeni]MBB3882363.1 RsiW-degrading membrane proteinase PrsW (M82 family) [Acetobacter oeni]NHO18535.1 hypothetical protein [Acetobacter oeni]
MHSLTLVLAAAAIGLGFAASEHIGINHSVSSHDHLRRSVQTARVVAAD